MTKNKYTNLLLQTLGCFISAAGIYSFAVAAEVPVTGIAGICAILYRLFGIPMGLSNVLINIPIILLTFRQLGKEFFLISVKSVLISSLLIDYVCCYLPAYTGSRLTASILSGIMAGIGFSLFFNEGSSTGGTDFIIVAVKQKHPKLSFGLLAFFIDGTVIVLSVFVFKEIWAFVYGAVYTVVTSLSLDGTTWLLKKLRERRQAPVAESK